MLPKVYDRAGAARLEHDHGAEGRPGYDVSWGAGYPAYEPAPCPVCKLPLTLVAGDDPAAHLVDPPEPEPIPEA